MIPTVRQTLAKAYANLAMAHAAVDRGDQRFGPVHFMIRGRLRKGLESGTMRLGSLLDDERARLDRPQACAWCGSRTGLQLDHLIPKSRGGPETADNAVWACRPCNGSKGAKDPLRWLAEKGRFPPLLILRRYMKLAFRYFEDRDQLDGPDPGDHPFELDALPMQYPSPTELILWVAAASDS
ncbi:MAG: HNH endonuclease [bacterium]